MGFVLYLIPIHPKTLIMLLLILFIIGLVLIMVASNCYINYVISEKTESVLVFIGILLMIVSLIGCILL